MAKPYSDDLRERVVRAVEGGSSRHEAAGQFDVSVSFVVKLMQRVQATGSFRPGDFGGHKEPKLAQHEAVVRELVEQAPSATLLELQKKLNERGVEVGKSSIGRFLKRLRIRGLSGICVRCHSDADGGRIWQSRKTPWTVCWRGVTRRLFSPRTGYSTS